MIFKSKILVFFATFLLSMAAHSTELTKDSVKGLLAKIDTAINNLDAQSLAGTLSTGVQLTIHMDIQGNKQTIKPSKQEYIAMLEAGWAVIDNYSYDRFEEIIDLRGSKAVVNAKVKETTTIQGQTIVGESKEIVTIELINGNALVTELIGYTSL